MQPPFPGMDPFLEEPGAWPGVHSRLINTISDILADLVSPHFFVAIEERVYITAPDDPTRRQIVPDLYLVRGPRDTPTAPPAGKITTPTLVEPLAKEILHDRYLEIRDTRTRAVITTIEVLLPFNKTPGSQGRTAFLHKREAVMTSSAHWIEIDLLRAGESPPEFAGRSDYYALLKRGESLRGYEVWYINLRDPLPTIAVPLSHPFADVPLDLQAVFTTVYARAHYAESVDYTSRVPLPALPPADAAWVTTRLQTWQDAQAEPPAE